MPNDLLKLISSLRKLLHKKEEILNLNDTFLSDNNRLNLFSQQIDELENAAKDIISNYADNENILFNFKRRAIEIQKEIEYYKPIQTKNE